MKGNNYPRIGLSLGSEFDDPSFSGDGYEAAILFEAGYRKYWFSNCMHQMVNDSTGKENLEL